MQWTGRVVTDTRGEPVTMGRTSVSLGMASPALGDDRGEHGAGRGMVAVR